jgi:hypothetical protein
LLENARLEIDISASETDPSGYSLPSIVQERSPLLPEPQTARPKQFHGKCLDQRPRFSRTLVHASTAIERRYRYIVLTLFPTIRGIARTVVSVHAIANRNPVASSKTIQRGNLVSISSQSRISPYLALFIPCSSARSNVRVTDLTPAGMGNARVQRAHRRTVAPPSAEPGFAAAAGSAVEGLQAFQYEESGLTWRRSARDERVQSRFEKGRIEELGFHYCCDPPHWSFATGSTGASRSRYRVIPQPRG